MFKLQPLDILVFEIVTNSLWDRIERWGLGNPYGHVGMYLGGPFQDFYESAARGVLITNIQWQFGKTCMVMRPKPEVIDDSGPTLINIAHEIEGTYDAYYGYEDILWFVIPRLILGKLGLPIPLKYHREVHMICSEAVAEVFWRVNMKVLPMDIVPLPGDFINSPILDRVWEGPLSLQNI